MLSFLRVVNYYNYSITDLDYWVNRFFTVSIAMNFDPYTGEPIHQAGIWRSGCLGKEADAQNFFYSVLQTRGWQQSTRFHKIWHKDDRKVIVCLVDDLRSCSEDKHTDLPYLFDRKTTVITDGWIGCPTQYQVWQLPPSFYGIYATDDAPAEWLPDLHYTFSINRIDTRRLKLMLELAKRVHLHKGYVNFNCQYEFHGDKFLGTEQIPAYFEQHWNYLSEEDQNNWRASYELIKVQVPLKNYSVSHEEIFSRSFLNIECETYSSDNSAAYSEKIFRLLTTPVPWTCYAGRYGIAYLESLGFDCMSDLIDHNHYDRLKEVENKVGIFIWKSLQVSKELRTADFAQVSLRCQQAAAYNRSLLKLYQANWAQEFDQWQRTFLPYLE